MARLQGIDPARAEGAVAARIAQQIREYGKPREGTLIMGRRPTILEAYNGMFAAIAASGLLPKTLRHMVNRRVALLVGCGF